MALVITLNAPIASGEAAALKWQASPIVARIAVSMVGPWGRKTF